MVPFFEVHNKITLFEEASKTIVDFPFIISECMSIEKLAITPYPLLYRLPIKTIYSSHDANLNQI